MGDQQYDSPIGPQRLSPFARLMQFVGLLNSQAELQAPDKHSPPSKSVRLRRKRERQNRRRGRLMAQRGRS
jgi:hypothetical protein